MELGRGWTRALRFIMEVMMSKQDFESILREIEKEEFEEWLQKCTQRAWLECQDFALYFFGTQGDFETDYRKKLKQESKQLALRR
jgi:SOS response regulatory protein OraA/RecX